MSQQEVALEFVPFGGEFQVNTYTNSDQGLGTVVSLTDGNFVIVWNSDGQDGSGFGVFGQVFSADGSPVGSEFRANTYTSGAQFFPSVAPLADGGFVATWDSVDQDGSGVGIFGQVFSADGSRVGSEFRANTYTSGSQYNLNSGNLCTGLTGGGFVVIWKSDGQDGSSTGCYGQVYTADGSTVGSEFRANTYTSGSQSGPVVVSLTSGSFVVMWQSDGQDGSGVGVYGQVFSADGSPVGSEFRANTYTNSAQYFPSIAPLPDGGFVATWDSFGRDGSGLGVFGQLFSADGSSIGSEFRVNTTPGVYRSGSSMVTSLTNGGFVSTWSNSQDSYNSDVFGQVFSADGSPVGSEFRVNTYTSGHQGSPISASLANGAFLTTWGSNS
jgi:hypothetical protein